MRCEGPFLSTLEGCLPTVPEDSQGKEEEKRVRMCAILPERFKGTSAVWSGVQVW